jgi:hypothetical protein
MALNKTQDEEQAKEISQEIFVDIWERRASLNISNVARICIQRLSSKLFLLIKTNCNPR